MPTFVTVRVIHPELRDIYLNSDYTISAGKSPNDTFTVPTGRTVFETLDAQDRVDFAAPVVVAISDAGKELKVILAPVIPPRSV